MMVCYDGFFPEVARQLANRGAEVIAWPVWGCNPDLARARAMENHVYVVSSTYEDIASQLDAHGGVGPHAAKRSPWPRSGARSSWPKWTSTSGRTGGAWATSRRSGRATVLGGKSTSDGVFATSFPSPSGRGLGSIPLK